MTGHIQTGSYTNKEGQKVYTTDIIVEDQEFAESKASAGNAQNGNDGGQSRQPNNYQPRQNNGGYGNSEAFKKPQNEGFMQIPDDVNSEGLPFN